MPVRIRVKGDNKILIKYNNPMEEQWLMQTFAQMRDSKRTPITSVRTLTGDDVQAQKLPMPLKPNPVSALKPDSIVGEMHDQPSIKSGDTVKISEPVQIIKPLQPIMIDGKPVFGVESGKTIMPDGIISEGKPQIKIDLANK